MASFNVLNYFTTLTSEDEDARGADTLEEFERQRTKILAAITAIDADVVGLMEIENNDEALQTSSTGSTTPRCPAATPTSRPASSGRTRSRSAFIYQPARVTPVGDHAILDSTRRPAVHRHDRNRPALAQTFEDNDTGGRLHHRSSTT